jgi:hypothetical protein
MAIQILTSGRTIIKKIVVGVPLTKNVTAASNINTISGVSTIGRQMLVAIMSQHH